MCRFQLLTLKHSACFVLSCLNRLTLTLLLCGIFAAGIHAQERLCDVSYENCKQPLIDLINAETVGLDVAFWTIADNDIANAILARHRAGVPVRILVDPRSSRNNKNPETLQIITNFALNGIPMRAKPADATFMHLKFVLAVGQNKLQFSGANYNGASFYPFQPYKYYNDEVIYFTDQVSIINSFKTQFEDRWVSNSRFEDYANINSPLVRKYPVYNKDPELNFQPTTNYISRLLPLLDQEKQAIDVIMFRITDSRPADQLITSWNRGVAVRLLTDTEEYRDVTKLYHAYNIDRLYMSGLPMMVPAHAGQNHEKSVIMRSKRMAVFGGTNWSNSPMDEHDYFTVRPTIYDWFVAHFNRKWNSQNPFNVIEYKSFVPKTPTVPINISPAPDATGQGTSVTFEWEGGAFAHKFDVLIGTNPINLQPVVSDARYPAANDSSLPKLSSGSPECTTQPDSTCLQKSSEKYTVTGLSPGTTYYWQIVGKTMADKTAKSSVSKFTTAGNAPSLANPSALSVTMNSVTAQASLAWTDTSSNETGFKIERSLNGSSFSIVGTIGANTTSYTDSGLRPNVRYFYRVRAYNGSGNSAATNTVLGVMHTAPIRLVAAATSPNQNTLDWVDTSSYERGFKIERSTDGFIFTQIATVSAEVEVYANVGIAPGTTYYYRVRAFDAGGDSAYSNIALATSAPANQPPQVTASGSPTIGSVPLDVQFSANATDTDGSIASYAWDFGDGTNSSVASPIHRYSTVGIYTARVTVTDNQGAIAVATVQINVTSNPAVRDIVLYAAEANQKAGSWRVEADTTAVNNSRLRHPNGGVSKLSEALAAPTNYFEVRFNAFAGQPYRLWLRGKADSNSASNDSVFVQFDNSVDVTGASLYRINTTSSTIINLEDYSGAGLSGWGWQDNGYGNNVLGALIYFNTSGVQTMRVQTREDGLSIDQIVLSPTTYINNSPGALQADTLLLQKSGSVVVPPTIRAVSPSIGTVTGGVSVTITGTDFSTGAQVKFGDVLATNVTVNSNTSVTATTPPHAAGSVDVVVTNADSGSATLANSFTYFQNQPPNVTASATPTAGTAPLDVVFTVNASDSDGFIAAYSWTFGDGATSNEAAPTHTYQSSGNYTAQLTVTDNYGATANTTIQISVAPVTSEIVLYGSSATPVGSAWRVVQDVAAAGGKRIHHPNAGVSKLSAALAAPTNYFEVRFNAFAGQPYRLWLRGKADSNSASNDSVFVQFDNSVDVTGASLYRINTTSSTVFNLEECLSCGLSNWGWEDNGWGVGVRGAPIYFNTSGVQTMRVQTREDGLSIDQIVISSATYFNASPGSLKNDATILPEANGLPNELPQVTIAATPTAGVAPLDVQFSANATDTDGSIASYAWNFGDGATSNVAAPSHVYQNAGTFTASLTVTDNDGATATATTDIIVTNPLPVITSVEPNTGLSSGGNVVTINGTNFQNGAIVSFGGTSATNVSVTDSTSITATTPPHEANTVGVSVTNPDGNSATLTNAFTYTPSIYVISGYVTGAGDVGIANAIVTLNDTAIQSVITTDASGSYSFTVAAGGDYTISVAHDNFAFTPASRTFVDLANDSTANFSVIVMNNSFESPHLEVIDAGERIFNVGDLFDGWTIESGNVRLTNAWQALLGTQSLDLNATGAGAIYQDIPTVAGQAYTLRFVMAGNPNGGNPVKEMEVWWGDTFLGIYTFDTTGHTATEMGWFTYEVPVVATGNATRLRFVSLTVGEQGPVVDGVFVSEISSP